MYDEMKRIGMPHMCAAHIRYHSLVMEVFTLQ